jgi:predicted dehydrogenase
MYDARTGSMSPVRPACRRITHASRADLRRSTIQAKTRSPAVHIGIVGAGSNARAHHIPGLRAIDGVEIVAVSNRTLESTKSVAEEFEIDRVHEDWRTLVDDDTIDAVVIGTWPNMHHPVTLAALSAGKHVLCEARMAMNSVEAHEMLEASKANPDLVAQLVPSPLSFGVDKTIRRLVDNGRLGTLISADIAFRGDAFPDPGAPVSWRENSELSGHNIMALGIWYESLMRWIGEASSVMAMGKTVFPVRSTPEGPVEVEIPNHLDVMAMMECGAQARFQMSSVTGLSPTNEATLYGSEAVLRFEDGQLLMGRKGADRLEPIDIPQNEIGSWRVEEDFIDAIRGLRDVPLTDFETGVRYMEFTDAVWMSMEQGRLVDLPLRNQGENIEEAGL